MPLTWSRNENEEDEDFDFSSVIDFSTIDNNQKAVALYEQNKVSKIHLMPLRFGGEDIPQNTLYVPHFVLELKNRYDNLIEELIREGKQLSYSAAPAYKGQSFIPSSITITASGDADFSETIEIW